MHVTKYFRFAVLAGAFACAPLPANAGSDQVQVSLRANVPLSCEVSVDFNPIKKSQNTYLLGTMEQSCNAPQGYRVIAEGGPILADAVMLVSGRPVRFDDTGMAILIEANMPGRSSDSLVLTTNGAQPSSLAVRIEALT